MIELYPLRFTLLLAILTSANLAFSQTIYVDQSATGNNDGTSWADAYTDLQDALDDDSFIQIWVAAGTYKPGGAMPDNTSVFSIGRDVSVLGGFNGTETAADQRDPENNVTILSGDIMDDDVQDDFANNKSDNTLHVVYIDSLLNAVTIDGFSVIGGHTTDISDLEFYQRAGGGIYCRSTTDILNCRFYNNFGRSGGSVVLFEGANNSTVDNCEFTHNYSTAQSAGVFILGVQNTTVSNSTFSNNVTNRGSLYPSYTLNTTVDNCTIKDNVNPDGFGAAMFSWQNVNLTIKDTDFINNRSSSAAGIYVDGREIPDGAFSNIEFVNCNFEKNTADSWGGGIYSWGNPDLKVTNTTFRDNTAANAAGMYISQSGALWKNIDNIQVTDCEFISNNTTSGSGAGMRTFQADFTMDNCNFDDNSGGGGSHLYLSGDSSNVMVKNTSFINANTSGWGGAGTAYGFMANYNFENCTYTNNTTANLGGAVNCGFGAIAIFDNCIFEENESINSAGGALSTQNDSTMIIVKNSQFTNNTSGTSGGAIFIGAGAGSLAVDKSDFLANTSVDGFGGAIFISEFGDDDISTLTVSNSVFGFNLCPDQGGAINIGDADTEITSCVFYENILTGEGRGGAISLNASDSNMVEAIIVNTTFAYNSGAFADGLVQWTGENVADLTTQIQNCIFRNDGFSNYVIEAGDPKLISMGGNMSDDASLDDILTDPSDLNGEVPDFNSPDDLDYSLADGSMGIDMGVAGVAPEFDILGNPRINRPDMGAYENQNVTKTDEQLIDNDGILTISPNPVRGTFANLELKGDWYGELEVRLYSISGQHLRTEKTVKNAPTLNHQLLLGPIKTGIYQVAISNGEKVVVEQFVKVF